MRRGLTTKWVALVVTALVAGVLAASAAGASATTEPIEMVPIQVSLTNSDAALDLKTITRGAVVQFRIRNHSSVRRTFAIGGLQTSVKPKGFGVILVSFDVRGKYPFLSKAATSVHRGFLRVV